MEWIDQFQQSLSRPVLDFLQLYWMFLVPLGAGLIWWFFGGAEQRRGTTGTDLTIGDFDGDGDGGSGDGGGGD
jgi:hypothetical protein